MGKTSSFRWETAGGPGATRHEAPPCAGVGGRLAREGEPQKGWPLGRRPQGPDGNQSSRINNGALT